MDREAYDNAGIPHLGCWSLQMYEGVDEDCLAPYWRTGYLANYNLSLSGGPTNPTTLFQLPILTTREWFSEWTITVQLRLNTDHKVRNWIKFGNSLNIFSGKRHGDVGQYTRALQKVPLQELWDDGSWGRIRNTALEHMHSNAVWLAETNSNTFDEKGIMGNYIWPCRCLKDWVYNAR